MPVTTPDPLLNLLTAGLIALPSILAWAQGIKNGRAARKTKEQVEIVSHKADAITTQANIAADHAVTAVARADELAMGQLEIHKLVNSNLSKVKQDLEEAKAEIVSLRKLIAGLSVKMVPVVESPAA